MRALKRQIWIDYRSVKEYWDTRFTWQTFNVCQRLFSRAIFARNDRRRAINPVNLELQVFISFNDLWGGVDINTLTTR